jgi:hypothetical protein
MMPLSHADVTQDFAVWHGTIIQGFFSGDVGYYFENQLRIYKDTAGANRLIIRPALRYRLSPDLTLFAGYAWVPGFTPWRVESRLWQQATWTVNPSIYELATRFRFEERWLSGTDSVAFRARLMLRGIAFFDDQRTIGFCASDEFFYALNTVSSSLVSGADQNRLFLGVNLRVGKNVQLEPGYTQIWQRLPATNNSLTHAWTLYVYVNP